MRVRLGNPLLGSGCYIGSEADPIVDAKLGLPSASVHNTAILSGPQKITSAEEVLSHE